MYLELPLVLPLLSHQMLLLFLQLHMSERRFGESVSQLSIDEIHCTGNR